MNIFDFIDPTILADARKRYAQYQRDEAALKWAKMSPEDRDLECDMQAIDLYRDKLGIKIAARALFESPQIRAETMQRVAQTLAKEL